MNMKTESVISERGQVTLPKKLRERLRLDAGTKVTFKASPQGIVIRRASGVGSPVRDVYGVLKDRVRTDAYLRKLRGKVE